MNVYDFDKTIYAGDSSIEFYIYSIKKNLLLLRFLPKQLIGGGKFIFGIIDKTEFKSQFFSFLQGISNVDEYLESFWKINISKIKKWYLAQKKEDDVIISASPEFLLKPVCRMLDIKYLIASDVDKTTGMFHGINCYGEEKVRKFRENIPEGIINRFYSDSVSDIYMAKEAEQAYWVTEDEIVTWEKMRLKKKKCSHIFLTREFLCFLIIGIINTINGIFFASIYSFFMNANIAFILGYISSLTISYILNCKINFKEKLRFIAYIKFGISYIPNFIIQNIIVFIVYNCIHLHQIIAYTISALIGVPVTFLMLKLFVFTENN